MCMVGDILSASSSSDKSAMLMELRSAMSSASSSPVKEVRVLPRAFSRLPILGSMWTSIPHIFQSTFSVQVPALLLSVKSQRKVQTEEGGGEQKGKDKESKKYRKLY